jgi:hypothetical protein
MIVNGFVQLNGDDSIINHKTLADCDGGFCMVFFFSELRYLHNYNVLFCKRLFH